MTTTSKTRGSGADGTRDGGARFEEAIASSDLARLRQALGAWADQVRAASGDDDGARLLSEACMPLASHADPKIRQAVAEAADVVPEEVFDYWLARFTVDDDHYVRAAIARAAKRRAMRRKARARQAEHDKVVDDLLRKMEKDHGEDARRLAERALRRGREAFVLKLHHEALKIVTPLQFSLSCLRSEVARPDLDRTTLARNIGIARERLNHLWATIDRARAATASVTPRFRRESLLPLVEEARAHLFDRIGPRASCLVFVVEVAPDVQLDVDRSALLQALQNFLQNAVEAYPEDAPRMDVSVAARALRAGSQVEIAVVDRGTGMSETQRDQLFVPFGSRKPGGTGVGLVIARTMIEEVHGGQLTLESAPDVGTKVTMLLPARQAGRTRKGDGSRS